MSLVSLKNVTLDYGAQRAVEGVSAEINEGDYLCLVGSNGSGKSTLLKGILGLHPATKGEIVLHIEQKELAYLPQSSGAERGFPITVREVVLTGRQWRGHGFGFYSREDRAAAQEAMELLKISDLAARRIGELSGGQQQRAYLARALCRKPRLLLLDEPCSGLDPEITSQFYELLTLLHREKGLTIMMTSHDLGEVSRCASRVMVLNTGLEFDGSVSSWIAKYDTNCTIHSSQCDECGRCDCVRRGIQ